ncbi:TIGR03032 family protein [Shimia thalassica]|uniref:TIGR03032 family protein n=1 Tax=Shimia thalassica TaxID=1715693 RepID=UPI0026E3A0F1|nr:TIGR03032 family protein [Shimia thalassica]MDO6479369.1 TIGR03032 family protein [Shimia thalassica]
MITNRPNPSSSTTLKGGEKSQLLLASQGFVDWLETNNCSVALTTYQAGRLFLIGRKPNGALRAHERLIEQCQGLWTDGQTLWTSGQHSFWRFENDLKDSETSQTGVDKRFVPREGRVTGQIDIHDIGVGDTNQFSDDADTATTGPIFVCTAYNCLATTSETASFRPLWRPPFISQMIREDRCHLNGLAMDGTRAAFVSAVSRSDVADGWRERRRDGGVVLDVASGEAVATGLSMPHSPRLYEGKLWVLNSGRGELCTIDPDTGDITPVAFCPGYARGLAFVGRYAVVGLSRPRKNQTFEGLELDDLLKQKDTAPRSGLLVIDIDTGRTVEWLRFEHTIDELYDVAILHETRQPEAIGFHGDAIKATVRVEM